jgi:hypothetical protein
MSPTLIDVLNGAFAIVLGLIVLLWAKRKARSYAERAAAGELTYLEATRGGRRWHILAKPLHLRLYAAVLMASGVFRIVGALVERGG